MTVVKAVAASFLAIVMVVHSTALVLWALTALDSGEYEKAGFFFGLLLIFLCVCFAALNL